MNQTQRRTIENKIPRQIAETNDMSTDVTKKPVCSRTLSGEILQNKKKIVCEWSKNNRRDFFGFDEWKQVYPYFFANDRTKHVSLHEIITAENKVKPYFDIDAKIVADDFKFSDFDVMEEFRTALHSVYKIEPANVLMSTSHSETKKSFHIVVNGYFVESVTHVHKMLADISKHLVNEIKKYVDRSVYKPNQSFRTLWSVKSHADLRQMIPWNKDCGDDDHENNCDPSDREKQWTMFCIQNVDEDGFVNLTGKVNVSTFKNNRKRNSEAGHDSKRRKKLAYVKKDDPSIDSLIEDTFRYLQNTNHDTECFEVSAIEDHDDSNMIVHLTRLSSGYCSFCKRTHDSDNACLHIENKRRVWYRCWRSEMGRVILFETTEEERQNETQTPLKHKTTNPKEKKGTGKYALPDHKINVDM